MQQKLIKLIDALSENLVERKDIVQLSLLTMLAGENLILIGPPGTAKSEIGRRMSQVVKDVNYYEYLLTKFTTPEEVFGPLSIKELKEGNFKRNTQGYLPTANVIFLDEIFKANSAILNSLLTILNEKIFHNGKEKEKSPLISLIGASNELPIGDEELSALYDRFLVRKFVGYVSEKNIDALFHIEAKQFEIDENLKFTINEIESLQKEVQNIEIPQRIIEVTKKIRRALKAEFKENMDESFSDRRLVKIQKLLKSSAFTNNRKEVNISDILLLKHCLWNNPENIDKVSSIINSAIKQVMKG